MSLRKALATHAWARSGLLPITVAFGLLAAPVPATAAPAGAIDGGPCIAFDAHGYRYIAFGRTGVAEPGIYLATNRSGTWRLSPHPIAVGIRCAGMLVDAARHVHLLAVHPLTEDPVSPVELHYVTNKSGAWRSSNAYGGEIGDASLALDRTGLASVAIRDQEGVILLQRSPSGGWLRRFTGDGQFTQLRRDPSGTLWLVTVDDGLHRLARLSNRSGTWTLRRVSIPYSGGRTIDLTIDQLGDRFLVTHDLDLAVAIYRDAGGSWVRVGRTRTVTPRFLWEAETEPSGAIHLVFFVRRSATSFGIVDMNRHDGVWHTQLVGYASSFRSDLAVDGRGRVGATFERDGVVWSYWNNWIGTPHRFRVSDL